MKRNFIMLASLVLGWPHAMAQSIISGAFDPVADYPLAAQWNLDFNGDGVNELQINATFYDLGLDWTSADFTLSGAAQSLSPAYLGLAAGTTIGPDSGEWADLAGSVIYWSDYNGQNGTSQSWCALSPSAPYLPFRFSEADGWHYGWVRIATSGIPGFQDWAYQTASDTLLAAGDVPEPSTFALLALSSLAIGLMRRKV